MTPYTFECPDHGEFQREFPMGEAPSASRACPTCGGWGERVFGAVMKFTYGKERFHGATINEQLEAQHKQWADEGRKVEYVGSRWV